MRVVLTGSSGQLGRYVLEKLEILGCEVDAWASRSGHESRKALRPVELTEPGRIEAELTSADPAVVIHLAALSAIEQVRLDPERARLVNVVATERIAAWCAEHGRKLLYSSTDLVFDGRKGQYVETDPPAPLMGYGRSKLAAEPAVLATPGAVVARLSLLYGPARPGGAATYLDRTIASLRTGHPASFFVDEFRSPLDLATAAEAVVGLALSEAEGLVHVGGPERLSRFALAERVLRTLGLDLALVTGNRQAEVTFPEPRPVDVSLDSTCLLAWLPPLRRPSVEEATRRMWTGV